MDYQTLIDSMSPDIYQNLKRAMEIGKWPDGRPLSGEQRALVMEALIAWGRKHLPEEQRVGYIDRGHKAGEVCDDPGTTTIKWRDSNGGSQ